MGGVEEGWCTVLLTGFVTVRLSLSLSPVASDTLAHACALAHGHFVPVQWCLPKSTAASC